MINAHDYQHLHERASYLKKAMKTIEHLAGAQKNHAEQKVVFNTNEDR